MASDNVLPVPGRGCTTPPSRGCSTEGTPLARYPHFVLLSLLSVTPPLFAGCTSVAEPAAEAQIRAAADAETGVPSDQQPAVTGLAAEQDAQLSRTAASALLAPRPPSAALTAMEAGLPSPSVAAGSPELDALIARYARLYQVPERLVRRVVKRESDFNPSARNRIYLGLMQIRHDTARTMGYRGPASGLLDAETNLKYAVKYLRGAYITAGGDEDRAVRLYARGYYYDAKRKGLLTETGLRDQGRCGGRCQ